MLANIFSCKLSETAYLLILPDILSSGQNYLCSQIPFDTILAFGPKQNTVQLTTSVQRLTVLSAQKWDSTCFMRLGSCGTGLCKDHNT